MCGGVQLYHDPRTAHITILNGHPVHVLRPIGGTADIVVEILSFILYSDDRKG